MEGAPTPSQLFAVQTAATAYGDRHGNTATPPSSISLHAVRKSPAKPWKKPTALPIPPKVYRVDPRGFRQLVQRLTGATELASGRRLREAAPAPLDLAPRPCAPPPQQLAALPMEAYDVHGGTTQSSFSFTPEFAWAFSSGESAAVTEPPQMNADVGYQSQEPLQMNADVVGYQSQVYTAGIASPSLYSACMTWCNLPLQSPGSMACLEQSTVL